MTFLPLWNIRIPNLCYVYCVRMRNLNWRETKENAIANLIFPIFISPFPSRLCLSHSHARRLCLTRRLPYFLAKSPSLIIGEIARCCCLETPALKILEIRDSVFSCRRRWTTASPVSATGPLHRLCDNRLRESVTREPPASLSLSVFFVFCYFCSFSSFFDLSFMSYDWCFIFTFLWYVEWVLHISITHLWFTNNFEACAMKWLKKFHMVFGFRISIFSAMKCFLK